MGVRRRPVRPRPASSVASTRSTRTRRSCSRIPGPRSSTMRARSPGRCPTRTPPARPQRQNASAASCSAPEATTTAGSSGPSVLRRTPLNGSYYRADRTFVCELALNGAFYHVPEWLYFRRDHPNRAARAFRSVHGWCVNLDPRRESRLRNPAVRLYCEYLWGFISAIRRSPLTPQSAANATATFGSGPPAVPSPPTESSSASPPRLRFPRSRSTRSSPAGKAG